MHGLINRAIEEFTRATYGDALWTAAATAAGADPRGFVMMRHYDTALTWKMMRELARRLSRSPRELAEDIGAWIAGVPSIRRLLRFSGSSFDAFVAALPEMQGRALMVVRGFQLPALSVSATAEGWTIVADAEPIWIYALSGMLRAMADDYGVLAVIEVARDQLQVSVPLTAFSEGRPFSISDPLLGVA